MKFAFAFLFERPPKGKWAAIRLRDSQECKAGFEGEDEGRMEALLPGPLPGRATPSVTVCGQMFEHGRSPDGASEWKVSPVIESPRQWFAKLVLDRPARSARGEETFEV